jgi:hypothetical protein
VRQVGYLQRLYLDARSIEHKKRTLIKSVPQRLWQTLKHFLHVIASKTLQSENRSFF